MSDLEVTVNITRQMIREVLLNSIKELHEEQGFEMRDIISELLSIASAAVTRFDSDINEVTITTFGADTDISDSDDDYDEEEQEWAREMELREEFNNSDINKQIQTLLQKRTRLNTLRRDIDVVKVEEEILALLPEHVMRWNTTIGNDKYADDDDTNVFVIETLMRAYVALLDRDGLERLRAIVLKLNQLTNFTDQEIFDMEYNRFKEDIATMSDIYEYLRNHPQFPQKSLFKELSIDGRKALYMLNWAERLGRISRVRHKDTWLLSINGV